jgi:hypothetical protein
MPRSVILDRSGENPVSPERILVEDDRRFLENVEASTPLFVRGRVCDWVSELARARGWDIEWRTSPSDELASQCPSLSLEAARRFLERIPRWTTLPRPLSVFDIAVLRWPELDDRGKTETEYAWSWLLWRARATVEEEAIPVASAIANHYIASDRIALAAVQGSTRKEAAWRTVKEWLRCEKASLPLPQAREFEIPNWVLSDLREEWRIRAIESKGAFFVSIVRMGAPLSLLKASSAVAAEYFRYNPDHLTSETLELIKGFLPFREWSVLQRLKPVPAPGPPPAELDALFEWYTQDYLSYRVASQGSDSSADLQSAFKQFGLWYLRFYSNARTGGLGGQLMSWTKTAKLSEEKECVKLLLVLDGLGYVDGRQISQFISEESARLSFDALDIVLSPLPTITHFAKRALIAGMAPLHAFDEDPAQVQTRDRDVISSLDSASPGDTVILSILEPDKTYHKQVDTHTTIVEVEGRLKSIAARLAHIVHSVDDKVRLRVYVTTDHGRMLGQALRAIPVPHGMTAHGRAAWGNSPREYDVDGISVDGEVAFLEPGRFGIPDSTAVILSDAAFMTNDGKAGTEPFPHGGVFPEEVFIPWMQFTRDRGPVNLDIRIKGSGRAGALGKINIEVDNASTVRVQLVEIGFSHVEDRLIPNWTVNPMQRTSREWSVASWPEKKAISEMRAVVTYAMPNGERSQIIVRPELQVEEMYTREDVLADLL